MQPQKPSCPPPPKRRESTLKLQQSGIARAALDEDQTSFRADLSQEDATLPGSVSTDADSQRKPDIAADGQVKAVPEQLSAAEAQKLKELVETVVLRVFGKLKVPQDKRVDFLKNAALGIRGTSGVRAEPSETPQDRCQEMEAVAQELVATVLEMLGDHLESKASDPGATASLEEQSVDGGATQADKSEEAETATSHRACLEACLDKLTRLVVKNVRNLLKSMVASQFEKDTSCEYTEILELPKGQVSNRQPEPSQKLFSKQGMEARRGIPGASKRQRPEASTGVKLPHLQPKRRAERTGYAKTLEPEVLATAKESLENEVDATTSGNTFDIRTMAKQIIQSAIQRICHCGPAPTPEEDFEGTTTTQGRKKSGAAEDTLSSVSRRPPRQPVPPVGPKPPAQAGARRRAVRPKPV
ncbi:fibrous sheath-interacting protein 2 isoform X1 [Pitangus sulphuratus]|nr:fibrous sheath-interacting protein 2 isoform X1 [Pitangus sulphuratus]